MDHCTASLQFNSIGWIQTSQTGYQPYSDASPYGECALHDTHRCCNSKHGRSLSSRCSSNYLFHYSSLFSSFLTLDGDWGDPADAQDGGGPEDGVHGEVDPVEILPHRIPENVTSHSEECKMPVWKIGKMSGIGICHGIVIKCQNTWKDIQNDPNAKRFYST